MDLNKNLGTRHRAGVGISEVTDSFTIIVSEETGNVSYASGGELHTAVTPSGLREQLHKIQKLAKKPEEKKGWHIRGMRHEKENSEKASEQSPFENSFYPDCHCNLVRCGQCE
jgi:diadenylate cyclase